MGRSTVVPAVKAAALADLVAGEQPAVVAERHGINRQTVKAWRARLQPNLQPALAPEVRPSIEARRQHIGELVLDLLAAKLEASAAIAKAASDPAWLGKQPGSELAAIGEWLDATAFAIGDRLAGRSGAGQPGSDTEA